jgi:hypothetical protein
LAASVVATALPLLAWQQQPLARKATYLQGKAPGECLTDQLIL